MIPSSPFAVATLQWDGYHCKIACPRRQIGAGGTMAPASEGRRATSVRVTSNAADRRFANKYGKDSPRLHLPWAGTEVYAHT